MQYKQKTDAELVVLLTLNDEEAFSESYVRYKSKLQYFCFHFLKVESEACDIVQEVFIRIWESRCFINPELSFSSFLYVMARNRVLNYFKHIDVENKIKDILAKQSLEEENIESDLISTEYQDILRTAIEHLPPQRKKIFNMSRIDGMSHKEIAAILNISVYTVQEHISEALAFIRHYFAQHSDLSLGLMLLWII